MVSTDGNGGEYQADLVRLICADNLYNPDLYKEQKVSSSFDGSYGARRQETYLGSYVEIASKPELDQLTSFTIQTMVMPTLLPAGVRPRGGGRPLSRQVPVFQDQHLVSRWDTQEQHGWALIIDAEGCLAFLSGDGQSKHRTTLNTPLTQDQWFFVMASYDATSGLVSLYARQVSNFVDTSVAWPETRVKAVHGGRGLPHLSPLRFAACSAGAGNGKRLAPALCFSGRLDRVRLSAGVLSEEQAFSLRGSAISPELAASVIGFWDFGKGIASIDVHDLSKHNLHGVAINMPMRAVAGVDWDHTVTDWRRQPDHYSAIHFHDDDLYDAEWQSDFSFTVPEDLPTGIYAARLRHGDSEDHIPFFVAPPKGATTARVALLIPTATYTAYSNIEDFTWNFRRQKKVIDSDGKIEVVEQDITPGILQDAAHGAYLARNIRTLGRGLYANHTDGTLFAVASQRHPNMIVKPKGIQWTLVADTLIVDWLVNKNISHDIITDELLHDEGVELLSRYRVVITGNHPEYYTKAMLDAVKQYEDRGGRLMYLGGNGFVWVTSFHPQMPGAIEVRKTSYSGKWKPYEMFHAFDGIHGGPWADNGRAPHLLVGVSTANTGFAWEASAAYRRLPDSYNSRAEFIFAGVQNEVFGDYGVMGDGAAGQEFDCVSAEQGTPRHALHLARADNFPDYVSMFTEEYALHDPRPFGDIVYFETANGGAVFSAASMCWAGSLSYDNYKNDVSTITENVLRRFLDDAPLAGATDELVGDVG